MWVTENPWPPLVICLAFAAFLAMRALTRRSKLIGAAAALFVLAGGACYVVDELVVTERERLAAHIDDLAAAVTKLDTNTVVSYLSPLALKEQAVVRAGMAMLDGIDDLRIRIVSIELKAEDSLAETDFRANGNIRLKLMGELGHQPTRWRLTWRKEADQWKITGIHRLNPVSGEEMGVLDRN